MAAASWLEFACDNQLSRRPAVLGPHWRFGSRRTALTPSTEIAPDRTTWRA